MLSINAVVGKVLEISLADLICHMECFVKSELRQMKVTNGSNVSTELRSLKMEQFKSLVCAQALGLLARLEIVQPTSAAVGNLWELT
jgi:hypothetical protein